MRRIRGNTDRKPQEDGEAVPHLVLDRLQLRQIVLIRFRVGALLGFDDEQVIVVVAYLMNDDVRHDTPPGEHTIAVGQIDRFWIYAVTIIFDGYGIALDLVLNIARDAISQGPLAGIPDDQIMILRVEAGDGRRDDLGDLVLLHQTIAAIYRLPPRARRFASR